MAQTTGSKQDFATRLSQETLHQLDSLVQQGAFKTRTAAIEAAVDTLYRDHQESDVQRREAFERSCGALHLGIDGEALRRAEHDRLEWEASSRLMR